MESNTGTKLSILVKIIKLVKNWYVVPLAHYGLIRTPSFVLHLRNGKHLKLRTNSTDIEAFVNVWIIQEYNVKNFEINHNDTIIDIGAHIGLFSVYASQFCRTGKIISFEPVKENYDVLLENIRLNNLDNVSAFNLAVSGTSEPLKIYLNRTDNAAHTIYGSGENYVKINSTTLGDVIDSKCIEVDLIKLDCEGAEYDILDSLSEDHFKKIKKISMEYHIINNDLERLKKIKMKLQEFGFNIITKSEKQNYGLIFADKQ